jgi:phosphatidylglycerol:prolipoprotein diacylglycerol transferase
VIDVRAPGARLGVWSALVGLGVIIAIALQAVLAARAEMDVARIVQLSLVASLAGLVGAKLYFLALHRGARRGLITTGMCLQGFVLGAVGTAIAGALVLGISPGELLDATAPGLLFALAVGRIGCFLGGCCAGRPTASRLGLWSSDRRLSTRRVPTQLFESTLAGSLGMIALAIAWTTTPQPAGTLFVATIAAFTLGRQLVLPLRDIPRKTTRGRIVVVVATGAILIADIAVATLI